MVHLGGVDEGDVVELEEKNIAGYNEECEGVGFLNFDLLGLRLEIGEILVDLLGVSDVLEHSKDDAHEHHDVGKSYVGFFLSFDPPARDDYNSSRDVDKIRSFVLAKESFNLITDGYHIKYLIN